MATRFLRGALVSALLLVPRTGVAREVLVPLRLDHAFLQRLLLTQVYTGPDASVRMWDDGSGCSVLVLSDPRVDTQGDRLRIRSAGRARAGMAVVDTCLPLFDWSGTVEVLEEPVLDPSQPIVRFRVVDSNLYGTDGTKSVTGTVWDWVKQYVHPRLEAVTVDLAQPLDEVRALLPLVLPQDDAARMAGILESVALVAPRAEASGLVVDLRVDVPEIAAAAATPPPPEPTLTPEELARWETAWRQWDAFLTFVSKHAAEDAAAAQRQALLDVLIEARYDILWVLRPSRPDEPDPVPALFVKTWGRLAPILRDLSLGLPGEAAVRYLSFIIAADALRAIQEMGPASGLDISADGLRRLARTIAPAAAEDPLVYDERLDPALRELFGFGAPLPTPAENPDVDTTSWWMPRPAWADDLAERLNRWAPDRHDVQEYLPLARELLNRSAQQTLAKKPLEERFHSLFGTLMLATAWKESCWRQYVRVNGRLTPLRSPVGALGIMQVNPRVWRGFYDVKGLQQDIGYNALAGSEILLHYLRDYAIARGEHTTTGDVDNLARATYAAYNGGPGHLTRYRKAKSGRNRGLRRIDESFWDKYRKVKGGDTLAVAECFGA